MFYEVILDAGETPNKCTIAPLGYRSDFQLLRAHGDTTFRPLRACLLLHHEGECITAFSTRHRAPHGIAAIDCVWRRLNPLVQRIEGDLPPKVRIPDGFVTAYPRVSKTGKDPAGGLATIEAIFLASALLGHWDATLLSEYYFCRRFLEKNVERLLALQVSQAADRAAWPQYFPRPRHSLRRRISRGRTIPS